MKKTIILILFIFPWVIGFFYLMVKTKGHQQCRSNMSVTYVMKNGDINYSRGIYVLTTSLNGRGSGVYSGEIVKIPSGEKTGITIPVHVSFTYLFRQLDGNVVEGAVSSFSKELGNVASDADLVRYLGPAFRPGEEHRTRLILLEGVRPAWGSTIYPDGICTL